MRRHSLTSLFLAAAVLAGPTPAAAIVILDSTWEASGGAEGNEPAGFAAHEALAQEAPFAATVYVEDSTGNASGFWIGNDDKHGYVITSGHALGPDEAWSAAHSDIESMDFADMPADLKIILDDGTEYVVLEVVRHPYFDHWANLAGADMAILVLETPVEGLGDQPALYCGSDELGKTVTFLGYGARGIGSVGANEAFDAPERTRTAGQTVIDTVEDKTNILRSTFLKDYANPDAQFGDGSAVSEYQAVFDHGDSGGPVFLESADGWAIVGLNTNSFNSKYNDSVNFSRLSTQRDFIQATFPGATFVDGTGGDCDASEHAAAGNGDIYDHAAAMVEADALR